MLPVGGLSEVRCQPFVLKSVSRALFNHLSCRYIPYLDRRLIPLASCSDPPTSLSSTSSPLCHNDDRRLFRTAKAKLASGDARGCLALLTPHFPTDNTYLLGLAARAYRALRDPSNALACARRATDLAPSIPSLWQLRGVLESDFESDPAVADTSFDIATELDPESVPTLSGRARHAVKHGRLALARQLISQAVQREPGHRQSLMLLRDLEDREGRPEAAERALERLLEEHPSDRHAVLAQAQAAVAAGQPRKARRLFRMACQPQTTQGDTRQKKEHVKTTPTEGAEVVGRREEGDQRIRGGRSTSTSTSTSIADAPLLSSWASFEARQRNVPRARSLFRRAHRLDPFHLPTVVGWASLEGRAGDTFRALSLLDRALQHHPRHSHLLVLRAQILEGKGQLDEAMYILQDVVKQDPDRGKAWHVLGLLHQRLGDSAEARDCFRRGCGASDPDQRLLCYEGLADFESAMGRRDFAATIYAEGASRVEADGGAVTSRYLRAWAALEKRRATSATNPDPTSALRALELFVHATQVGPGDAQAWLWRGLWERKLGRSDAAVRSLTRASTLSPLDPATWISCAKTLAETGDVDRARQVFADGAESCPRAAPLWMEWGLLEHRDGGRSETRQRLRTAVLMTPVHLPAVAAWASVEEELGEMENARRLWELYRDLDEARLRGGRMMERMQESIKRSNGDKHGDASALQKTMGRLGVSTEEHERSRAQKAQRDAELRMTREVVARVLGDDR